MSSARPVRPRAAHLLDGHAVFLMAFLGAYFAVSGGASVARADYPIVSHRYLADPGSLVHDGRIYLYNSNDDDNPVEGGYAMRSVVAVSTNDLKNWTDHGVVFQVPANASWARLSWAPQAIARDGKIYLYFGNGASNLGVASSTSPIGGFRDARGETLVHGGTPGAAGTNMWLFDPGALIDDDGQAYLSFGGNGEKNARIIRLGSDLTSVTGSAAQLAPKGFFEASFLFKRNEIYYFAYSTDTPNGLRIDYLTSNAPMSGYTYRGVLAGQPPSNNNNNHASEFEFKGKWYHAYHNRVVATQAKISTTYRRNLAIEVLDFNGDGSIKPVVYTTDGVPQVGYLHPYARVEAETTNAQSGIETEPCSDGGMDVTQIQNNDWSRVRGVDFGNAGAKTFSARVASVKAGGAIEVRTGGSTGTLVATCSVPNTGGLQTWTTTRCDVSGATGVQDVTFRFTGPAGDLFNFDWWQFGSNAPQSGDGGTSDGGTSDGGTSHDAGSTGRSGSGGSTDGGARADATSSRSGAPGSRSGASGASTLDGAIDGDDEPLARTGNAHGGTSGEGSGAAGLSGRGGRDAGAQTDDSRGDPANADEGPAGGCTCIAAGTGSTDVRWGLPWVGLLASLLLRRRRANNGR